MWLAAGSVGAVVVTSRALTFKRARAAAVRRAERNAYLPEVLTQVRARAAAADEAPSAPREMSPDDLAHLRYAFDIALMPYGDFSRYSKIDQFQPAAIRYQINQLGYTLTMSQAEFTPNFRGYLDRAQRQLIELYLHRKVWQYWRYENAWGNFSLNPDPAIKDNIMLTGYYGLQVALYTGQTGDTRYCEPGALTFKLDDKRGFPHNLDSIVRNIKDNFEHQEFLLYPCEPNWIYTGCNFRGLNALAAHDRAFGTRWEVDIRNDFRERMREEFITPDGTMIALRSAYTGLTVPFPVPDSTVAMALNPSYPDLAEQYWAFVRREVIESGDQPINVESDSKGIDAGNYKQDREGWWPYLLIAANEMGDYEVAAEVLRKLDAHERRSIDASGVLSYGFSPLTEATLIQARLMRRNSWRNVLTQPPAPAALHGPVLDTADYPEVLVAQAISSGDDLNLVVYPGTTTGSRTLQFGRLVAHGEYRVITNGAFQEIIRADASGAAAANISLTGRMAVRLEPASDRLG
ncbi:hypothetical protein ACIHDR_24235 [Nocardia sp. NPDC052278]|uniref:linalool dehydratase/isomerase domain-containing protein n=1 Tax=unclassified Nocardia TaxID=2637762 RepID=UPI0036B45EB3